MEKQWILPKAPDPGIVAALASGTGTCLKAAELIALRGLTDVEEAKRYLDPKMEHLFDPFLIPEMDKAVLRVREALSRKEEILIHGDYDVDGTSAAALLVRVLKGLGARVSSYIPNRLQEGYGLSELGVKEAKARGAGLLITVDCGVTAVQETALAKSLGVEVIVIDHHQPGPERPDAVAVIDPHLQQGSGKDDSVALPGLELSGVGLAFKFLQALFLRFGRPVEELAEHLDLAAVGTVADVVPLVGENRIIVRLGLEVLRETRKPGLAALLEVAGFQGPEGPRAGKPLGYWQVAYGIAPRINAVGRMGDAGRAVDLMLTEDEEEARTIAQVLQDENLKRRELDSGVYEEARELAKRDFDPVRDRVLVLAREGWHPGVIGIVASKLAEAFYRPTVVIALDGEEGRGSARSIPAFHLYEALLGCEDLLLGFGGHEFAAGLSIEKGKIGAFRERMNRIGHEVLKEEDLVPKLSLDAWLELSEVTPDLLRDLRRMAPFGPGNREPLFLVSDLQVVGEPRIVGANHLKFKVRQDRTVLGGIAFDAGERYGALATGQAGLSVACVLEEDEWQGKKETRLRVKDFKTR